MASDGSPDLLSGPAPAATAAASSNASGLRGASAKPVWGIFVSKESPVDPLIQPDSFLALDYHREWAVADFPMEQGAFSSYDKVAKPFDVRLRLAKGGSEAARAAFLADMETLGESLVLYDVVTPTRTYLGVTISSIGYQQTAKNGVGLITVEVGLRQVRETASSAMSAAIVQDQGSADPANGGAVQPQPVTPAAKAAVKKALAPASAANAASR